MEILFSSLGYPYNKSISSYKIKFIPSSSKYDHPLICNVVLCFLVIINSLLGRIYNMIKAPSYLVVSVNTCS